MGLPIADHWFERKRIDDEITLLWEPHVNSLLRCNIWHVRGRDRDAMIDSGLGIASLATAAKDLLQKEVVAVATHIHYDHVGGLHEFENRVMHRIEAPEMADFHEAGGLYASDMGEIADGLRQAGYEVPETLVTAVPEGFDPAEYRVTPTSVTRTVDEGDSIDLTRPAASGSSRRQPGRSFRETQSTTGPCSTNFPRVISRTTCAR